MRLNYERAAAYISYVRQDLWRQNWVLFSSRVPLLVDAANLLMFVCRTMDLGYFRSLFSLPNKYYYWSSFWLFLSLCFRSISKMFIKTFDVQSYWIDSVLRLNEHCILDACKTVTRVSVPFTEGHYCGMRKGQTRNWPPLPPGKRAARQGVLNLVHDSECQFPIFPLRNSHWLESSSSNPFGLFKNVISLAPCFWSIYHSKHLVKCSSPWSPKGDDSEKNCGS